MAGSPRRKPDQVVTTSRLAWLCGGLLALAPAAEVRAFAEDICPGGAGGWTDCSLQLCPPDMAEEGNLACEAIGMGTLVVVNREEAATGSGRRSTLHMDATYYLAQAVGLSPRQAFVIASYDQAADVVQSDWRDQQAQALVTEQDCLIEPPPAICELRTRAISAIDRNNFRGGGVNFHFMAPQVAYGAPPPPLDGMAPNLGDPYGEHFLVHLRRWAFGETRLLCVGGLTTRSARGDYATGAECYHSDREPSVLLGQIPFVSEMEPEGTPLESQVAWLSEFGEQLLNLEPAAPASAIDTYLGAEAAPLARMGIYLHALADRISHQLCNTHSVLEGPRPADAPDILTVPLAYDIFLFLQNAGDPAYLLQQMLLAPVLSNPEFHLLFDVKQCDQPSHAARHDFERGHDQEALQPPHRTLRPGLGYVYDELLAYARQHGVARPEAADADYRARVVEGLVEAISVAGPVPRLQAFCDFAQGLNLIRLPGYCTLDYAAWSKQAGPLALPDLDLGGDGRGSRSGGALSPVLLLFLLSLAGLRSRYLASRTRGRSTTAT
jgi:hypothetical protein